MKLAISDLRADQLLHVELKGVRSKKALLEALAAGLRLPRHFGHNWDALADCLMEASWAKGATISIVLLDTAGAEKRFGADWATLLEVLADAAKWWKPRGKALRVALA